MADALIGYSGFVGKTLLRQRSFEKLYRSTNICTISGEKLSMAICAGAPAQKWIANQDPHADQKNIQTLIENLKKMHVDYFVLISSVDVFSDPNGVSEDTVPLPDNLHAYGRHRLELENFVRNKYPNHLVVRLPGLVGPGLKKNILYDYAHQNNIEKIDPRAVFQFYPMVNLWSDLQIAKKMQLNILHLTAEPLSVRELIEQSTDMKVSITASGSPVCYDLHSRYARDFGGTGCYQYSARDTIQATRAYFQGERFLREQLSVRSA